MSPLANQDPLAQLNDIIAPTAPSWFPPAPIYWFLLFIVIGVVGAVGYLFNKHQKQKKLQKLYLLKLQQLEQQQTDFIKLNQLLKGCALSYFPRSDVASLHGEQWFDFLQQYSHFPIFNNKQEFTKRLYQADAQAIQSNDFIEAKKWITALPKQIKKAQQHV